MNLVGMGNLKIVQNYCNKRNTIKSGQIVYVQQDPRKTGYSVRLQPIVCEYKFKYRIQTLECGMFRWFKEIIVHLATFLCLALQNFPDYFMKGHCCLVDGAFLYKLSACLYMSASINQYIYPAVWRTTIRTSLTHYVQCGCCARCSWGEADKAKWLWVCLWIYLLGLWIHYQKGGHITRTMNTKQEPPCKQTLYI